MKTHCVFHVSGLEPAPEDPVLGQVMPPLPPVEIAGHEEWEIKEVLDSRLHYCRPQYFVKWVGYDTPTWQPAHYLKNVTANVERFHCLYPTRPKSC